MNNTLNWEVNQYAKLIDKILTNGEKRSTRAGDAYSIFGEVMSIDIYDHFPLLQGRKIFYKPVLGELAAFFRGPKHINDFKKFGCNYWDSWGATKEQVDKHNAPSIGVDIIEGGINVDYGNAWIDFNGVNQIEELIDKLRNNPTDRRLIVSGWRPDTIPSLSLPCCHMLYQWYVREGKYLDMVWYQRSVDVMVGLPSDIILASAWTIILANECGYKAGNIKLVLGDTHVYANHINGAVDYLRALNKTTSMEKAQYSIKTEARYDNFMPDDIEITNYVSMPPIKFALNV